MYIFLPKYVHFDRLCIFSYLNMFILINIYFVGHVYTTLFGLGEEAYLCQVVKGVSLFRVVLLLGGVYLFIFDSLSRGYFY